MAALAADRNLLFGLLAFQNNLIDRHALLDAFDRWVQDRSTQRRPGWSSLARPTDSASGIGGVRSKSRVAPGRTDHPGIGRWDRARSSMQFPSQTRLGGSAPAECEPERGRASLADRLDRVSHGPAAGA